MRRLRSRCCLCLLAIAIITLWAGLSPAQNTLTPAPAKSDKLKAATAQPASGKAEKKDERIFVEWVDRLTQEGDVYHLRGNVVFTREDMKVTCDETDYDEKADTAQARGHLRITDPNSVITGDRVEVDFGKELAVVTGSVTIVTQKKGNETTGHKPEVSLEKPGKSGAAGTSSGANPPAPAAKATMAEKPKDDKKPEHLEDYWEKKSTITCERLEYYYADDVKKMVATPRVKAVQEDKTAWADTAVFEDIPRVLTLTGNVVVTTDKGDEMRCAKAVIWVDEDRIEAQGATGVTLRKKKGEEPKSPSTPPQPAAQPPTPAPPPAPGP